MNSDKFFNAGASVARRDFGCFHVAARIVADVANAGADGVCERSRHDGNEFLRGILFFDGIVRALDMVGLYVLEHHVPKSCRRHPDSVCGFFVQQR